MNLGWMVFSIQGKFLVLGDLHLGMKKFNIDWLDNQVSFFDKQVVPYMKEKGITFKDVIEAYENDTWKELAKKAPLHEVVLDNGDYWIEIDNIQGGSNTCSDYDCSGAYGIEIIVTSTHYNAIQNGGTAIISFNYEWDDSSGNPFGSSDEVWIKSYWQSPTTGIHYLGSEQSSVGGDTTLEVDYGSQPDNDFSGTHTQDITSWIENAGSYYLVLGGKIYAGDSGEHGEFRFDDIQIEVTDPDDTVLYGNLWEHISDVGGAPADFGSGTLNYTANTFGISGSNDGWDWDTEDGTGQFGYDDDIDYNEIVSGQIEFDNDESGGENNCNNHDCSGAYGIEIEITNEMYNIMSNSGSAFLSSSNKASNPTYFSFET